jgi:hypothetical protein
MDSLPPNISLNDQAAIARTIVPNIRVVKIRNRVELNTIGDYLRAAEYPARLPVYGLSTHMPQLHRVVLLDWVG